MYTRMYNSDGTNPDSLKFENPDFWIPKLEIRH